jgi:hypothetical protein
MMFDEPELIGARILGFLGGTAQPEGHETAEMAGLRGARQADRLTALFVIADMDGIDGDPPGADPADHPRLACTLLDGVTRSRSTRGGACTSWSAHRRARARHR